MRSRVVLIVLLLIILSSLSLAAAPTVTSRTNPSGSWGNSSAISVDVSFASAEGYSYIVDASPSTEPDTTVDTTNTHISLGSKNDGTYWFHVRAKTSSGWSDTAHFELKVDTGSPSRPTGMKATSQPDGSVLIEWVASVDPLSGVAYYNIYRSTLRFVYDSALGYNREFSIRDPVAKKIGANITGTSFTDSNFVIGEGYRFHYKIQPVDNAGNGGNTSAAISTLTTNFCNLVLSLEAGFKDGNISMALTSDKKFKKGQLVVRDPEGKEAILATNLHDINSYSAGYSLSGKVNGDYNISFSANDEDAVKCIAEKVFVYDTSAPEVEILSPTATGELSGFIKVKIKASEKGTNPSGIAKVSLYLEKADSEQLIADAAQEDGDYAVDWNTLNFENGRFKVTARAFDRGGNKAEASKTYTIKNVFFARIGADSDIAGAEAKRLEALDFLKEKQKLSIDVSAPQAQLAIGDANLAYAKKLLEQGLYYELASQEAKAAGAVYAGVKGSLFVTKHDSANYTYNKTQLDVFLEAAGLDQASRPAAKKLIEKMKPERSLEILQVKGTGDGNGYYVANIVVSFTNTDRNSVSVKVAEIIPKRFTDDANKISSQERFEILRRDPVIVFSPIDANSGAKVEIIYGLKQKLTKAQADAFIVSGVMDYYVSPPIILPQSTNTASLKNQPLLNVSPVIPDLSSLKLDNGNIWILGGGVVLVLGILFVMFLLAAFGVYYFFIKKKR